MAVYSKANFGRVRVFLVVVFPPAHRAEAKGAGRLESAAAAAGAAVEGGGRLHMR